MLTALSVLALLVNSSPAPLDEVCELPNGLPGRATSRSCMTCHDGSVAPLAAVSFPSTLEGFENPTDGHGTHPVDVDYEAASLRRPGTLTPPGDLPVEILLTTGLVTCVTCHNPDSAERFRVSLSLDASALCRACHLN